MLAVAGTPVVVPAAALPAAAPGVVAPPRCDGRRTAPRPGRTAGAHGDLIAAALLAANGHLQIGLVVGLAAVGAIVGDNVGYVLGRRLGRAALVAR